MKILLINGPNLNMLGTREKNVYGNLSLSELNKIIEEESNKLGFEISFFQSNHEGEIIDKIHQSLGLIDGIIINPGAFTHYSYAIRDAIKAVEIKTVEVHISNIHTREEFRHKSVIVPVCVGQISGLGFYGYIAALKYFSFEVEK